MSETIKPVRYQLMISKIEANPDYDEAEADRVKRRREEGNYYGPVPGYSITPENITRTVDVMITEQEMEAIRHALLEVWK